MSLYEQAMDRETERRKFEAIIHGVEMKDAPSSPPPSAKKSPTNSFMFGEPDDYKHLSQEEKKELTKKMMGAHKFFAVTKPLGGKTSSTPKFIGG